MTLTVAKSEQIQIDVEKIFFGFGQPIFSPDGNKIVFVATYWDDDGFSLESQIVIKELETGAITLVSADADGNQGNSASSHPIFSPDGTKVAFMSQASNLVPNDTNETHDIFIKDLTTGGISLVSANADGNQGNGGFDGNSPVFSPDGTQIAFDSGHSNLVPDDTNGTLSDIFIKNLVTGAITLASTDALGNQGNSTSSHPVFSPDGSKIAFRSNSSNLVPGDLNQAGDIFIKDLTTGVVTLVSTDAAGDQGNGYSHTPVFSPDGTKVAFMSTASNLVSDDTNGSSDIFVKDLTTGAITRISTSTVGTQGNSESWNPVFSPDGTKVAFVSTASNLVSDDTIWSNDIFIKDLTTGGISLVSIDSDGNQRQAASTSFSPDGTRIVFSAASVSGNPYVPPDIFIAHLQDDQPTTFHGGTAPNTFYGGAGNDVVYGGGGDDILFGGDDNDVMRGEDGDDTVFSDAGNDNVRGGTGNDLLGGGSGNDSVWGEDGDDRVRGGDGDDRLSGGLGDDDVRGGSGIDIIYGNEGNDSLGGDDGNDWLSGSSGNDLMRGDLGDDTLYGGSGDDNLRGGEGADLLYGDAGSDVLYGENGDDQLFGGSGIDTLKGGAGNDILNGGAAGDKLFGGDGADAFVFGADALSGGWDTISDFSLAQGDTLRLEGLLEGFDPLSNLITDFVRITQSHSGNSYLSVDTNGDGSGFQQIARLNGVTGLTDESALLVDGTLIIA